MIKHLNRIAGLSMLLAFSISVHGKEKVPVHEEENAFKERSFEWITVQSGLDEAKSDFESGDIKSAQRIVENILGDLPHYRETWFYGNVVHDGNQLLGLVYLKKNDIQSAKLALIEAGKTPGSPQLSSFGPNMDLARELLKKGERETVLKYFEQCRAFWKSSRSNKLLNQWSEMVKSGKIPDFERNVSSYEGPGDVKNADTQEAKEATDYVIKALEKFKGKKIIEVTKQNADLLKAYFEQLLQQQYQPLPKGPAQSIPRK